MELTVSGGQKESKSGNSFRSLMSRQPHYSFKKRLPAKNPNNMYVDESIKVVRRMGI